ncbi:MAG TPA: hypothetical protein ENJ16_00355 [Planctomycetaceae bacterium]|nr:hypothetical protein [Planctomycetaceae bacterium]
MIAFWFHVNPEQLSGRTKAGLLANLDAMKAQHAIHLGNFDPADYETVYRLYLAAFGDADLAARARARAMEVYVDRKTRYGTAMDG